MKPLGREARGARRHRACSDPIGSIGVLADYVRRPHPARGAARPGSPGARGADAAGGPGLRPGQAAARRLPRRSCASTAGGIARAPVPPEAAGRRRVRHLRARSPCSRGSRRSSRSRASSPRARSATSPRPSAPARPRRVESSLDQIESQRRRAHDRDRQARLQARRVRLRVLRGLGSSRSSPAILGLVGRVHRRDGRQRRAAGDPRRPRRRARGAAVDRRRPTCSRSAR